MNTLAVFGDDVHQRGISNVAFSPDGEGGGVLMEIRASLGLKED